MTLRTLPMFLPSLLSGSSSVSLPVWPGRTETKYGSPGRSLFSPSCGTGLSPISSLSRKAAISPVVKLIGPL